MSPYEKNIHTLHKERLAGEITTEAIVSSVLDRLESTEDVIQAFLYRSERSACLEKAKLVDEKIKKGDEVGALEGMPLAIKDIFNMKGLPLTCASKILEGFVSPYESTVTANLEKTGYVNVGKLNMDEFAMGSSCENSSLQATKNPWDTDRVPGGSSGGSAAAVATGSCLGSLGTDTGGSIRQPAAFTGTVGIKPTYGLCSRYGITAFASSFDQAGVIAKDVEDATLILQNIIGFDENDSTSLNVEPPDMLTNLKSGVDGLKVGYIKNFDLSQCDDQIREDFEKSLELFAKNGVEVVPLEFDNIEHSIATYYIIACSEASSNLGRFDGIRYGHRSPNADKIGDIYTKSREEGFGSEVKLRILLGTFALSSGYYDAYYSKAKLIQNYYKKKFDELFNQVDVILSPVSPVLPFKLGEKIDDPLQMYLADQFTVIANLARIPGMSVPSSFSSEGLPIGIQLLTKALNEPTMVQTAYWFEQTKNITQPKLKI